MNCILYVNVRPRDVRYSGDVTSESSIHSMNDLNGLGTELSLNGLNSKKLPFNKIGPGTTRPSVFRINITSICFRISNISKHFI